MTIFAKGRAAVPTVDAPVDSLEVHMIAAIARGDAALASYTHTRNVQFLIDGLLDVRKRLTDGLPQS